MNVVNRVADSELRVLNLEDLWDGMEVLEFDIAPFLIDGLILREKTFRSDLEEYDWSVYRDKLVAVHCSTDAIVPTWAFMLAASRLHDAGAEVSFGTRSDVRRERYQRILDAHDWETYRDRNVVIKGCSGEVVPTAAYLSAVLKLQPVAAKLMFGEACSSVPLWRQPGESKTAGKAVPAKLPVKN